MSGITPLVCELKQGTHWICACGQTRNPPFCDGSHKGSEFSPVQRDIEADGTKLAWCRCRRSGKLPYCDGTHAK